VASLSLKLLRSDTHTTNAPPLSSLSGTTGASAFGTGTITIGDTSGTANATLNGGFAGTFTNAIIVASGSSGTATITSSAASIFSGTVTLSKGLTLTAGANNLTLSGAALVGFHVPR
jgi:hypothetical protein